MPVQASKALDPRNFVLIKPLPIAPPVGEKLQARSATVFSSREPSREQVFRDNYQRRLRQLSRQGYRAASWRPYEEVGEPLYLEAEKLILTSLGQLEEQVICGCLEDWLVKSIQSCLGSMKYNNNVKVTSECNSFSPSANSFYLEKLLEAVHQSVAKELQSSGQPGANPSDSNKNKCVKPGYISTQKVVVDSYRMEGIIWVSIHFPAFFMDVWSSPMCQPSAVSQFIASKSSLSSEMRARFSEKAEEVALSLNDTLENKAKKRWENGVRKFLSCEHWPQIQPDLHAVRTPSVKPETAETKENQDSNTWMSGLLSSIPETILEDRSIRCVLDKLVRFADGQSLRIRPNQFLKVLSGLRLWELCSPDFCVAVEVTIPFVPPVFTNRYKTCINLSVSLVVF
ncbi:CCD60 protein, partial [Amia calva]|nr:CCD60 protein [Amia calva]